MKNRKAVEKILTQDLIKYSQQIGLTAIPRLVFNTKDWDALGQGHGWTRRTKRDSTMGVSYRPLNIILVNLDYRGKAGRATYKGLRWVEWKPAKWGLREARHTLVHELVHIRWKMWHGEAFEKRIMEILRGREFAQV